MSEVKRWNVESDELEGPCSLWNVESAEGEFVTYEDYAALKEQFDFKQNLTEQLVALQKQRDAQPVKQPQIHDAHGFPEPAHIINSRWIEAIRAAGYEVQE